MPEEKDLRSVCRAALHYMETPGDFSSIEVTDLMDDLSEAGYPKCKFCGENCEGECDEAQAGESCKM